MSRSWLKKEFPFIAACPAVLWQVLFLIIPVGFLICISLYSHDSATFSLANYRSILSYPYLKSIYNACVLACLTVVCSLLISFPTSYCIVFYGGRHKLLLLILLMLPGWTNFIIRVYSWFFLLSKGGPISSIASMTGLFPNSVHFLGNSFAELLGMVYCYFPFMVLPLYGALASIEKSWIEAAADLGANRLENFASVILPLSLTGISVGSILVFLSSFGEFAIPEILGSAKTLYWGRAVANKFVMFGDFHTGAALTMLGITCAFVCMLVLSLAALLFRHICWFLFRKYCLLKQG